MSDDVKAELLKKIHNELIQQRVDKSAQREHNKYVENRLDDLSGFDWKGWAGLGVSVGGTALTGYALAYPQKTEKFFRGIGDNIGTKYSQATDTLAEFKNKASNTIKEYHARGDQVRELLKDPKYRETIRTQSTQLLKNLTKGGVMAATGKYFIHKGIANLDERYGSDLKNMEPYQLTSWTLPRERTAGLLLDQGINGELDKALCSIQETQDDIIVQYKGLVDRQSDHMKVAKEALSVDADKAKLVKEITDSQALQLEQEAALNDSTSDRVKVIEEIASAQEGQLDGAQLLQETQRSWLDMAKEGLDSYGSKAGDIADQMRNVFEDSFSSIEQSLTNFVLHGKLSFRSLEETLKQSFASMVIGAFAHF